MKMKIKINSLLLSCAFLLTPAMAGAAEDTDSIQFNQEGKTEQSTPRKSRLTLGGYGEAVMVRNMYSDNWKRYSKPELYKNDDSHGRFDLPHVVLFVGYDFGKGWSMGSEIEFEHGGTESAVEIEEEETGEYESEIERGGEVALEQFWLQKSFSPSANLRLGHMVVPVGLTNCHHNPTEFFGTYRPEGESTIIPCTWHETGISFWGRTKDWRYEAMFIAGLDADRFGHKNWIKGGAGSPYEFKIANAYAGVLRVDNYSFKGLRMGISGYVGNSASNTLKKTKKNQGLHGTVLLGSFDYDYKSKNENFITRGSILYGHLTNSGEISEANQALKGYGISPGTAVASDAISAGIELGYDMFSFNSKLREKNQKLYLFSRYDYYDSMLKMGKNSKGQKLMDTRWTKRQRVAVGLNYKPLKEIVIKAEYSTRLFDSPYNNEPSISLGVAYSGIFIK